MRKKYSILSPPTLISLPGIVSSSADGTKGPPSISGGGGECLHAVLEDALEVALQLGPPEVLQDLLPVRRRLGGEEMGFRGTRK